MLVPLQAGPRSLILPLPTFFSNLQAGRKAVTVSQAPPQYSSLQGLCFPQSFYPWSFLRFDSASLRLSPLRPPPSPRPLPAPPLSAHLCLQVSRRPPPATCAAGASPPGSLLPTSPSATPAQLLGLGLGPSGPQDRVRAAQGQAGGKVAGQGRGHGQVPPSLRRHPTRGAVRAPVGPWGLRGSFPDRRHHPP